MIKGEKRDNGRLCFLFISAVAFMQHTFRKTNYARRFVFLFSLLLIFYSAATAGARRRELLTFQLDSGVF